MTPTFFTTPSGFRAWLAAHHATATELTVGFHKLGSGKGGLTYPQALDEALCFGWIDGVRRSIDAHSYTIRFTPRRPKSIWSLVNIRHVERLQKSGLMAPAGLKAFAARDPARSGIYSFENARRDLAPAEEKKFRAAKKAWAFFQQQAPGYRRQYRHLVDRQRQTNQNPHPPPGSTNQRFRPHPPSPPTLPPAAPKACKNVGACIIPILDNFR